MDYGHPDEENAVDIIVTAPSSPEAPTNGITPEYDDSSELTKFLALDSLPVPTSGSMSAQPASVASSRTPFEDALAHASLPQPGPAYFAARREIWTTPRGARPTQPSQPSKRSRKFQAMLQSEGPIEDVYWRAGLDKIWKGLINGQRVREPLALRDLIKILQAGWIHDGTWPRGQLAPEPDDELKADESQISPTAIASTSRLTTPQMPLDRGS